MDKEEKNRLSVHFSVLTKKILGLAVLVYRKVASSRPVYYSILELFGQRPQYISIKFSFHKPSENPYMCYSRLYCIWFLE